MPAEPAYIVHTFDYRVHPEGGATVLIPQGATLGTSTTPIVICPYPPRPNFTPFPQLNMGQSRFPVGLPYEKWGIHLPTPNAVHVPKGALILATIGPCLPQAKSGPSQR